MCNVYKRTNWIYIAFNLFLFISFINSIFVMVAISHFSHKNYTEFMWNVAFRYKHRLDVGECCLLFQESVEYYILFMYSFFI